MRKFRRVLNANPAFGNLGRNASDPITSVDTEVSAQTGYDVQFSVNYRDDSIFSSEIELGA